MAKQKSGPTIEPMKVVSLVEPRALLVAKQMQGVIVYDDNSVSKLLCQRQRIAIHATAGFDDAEFEIVRDHLVGLVERAEYGEMPPSDFPKSMVLCTAVILEMSWLDELCVRGCLCDPRDKFGVVLGNIEPLLPPIYCERQAEHGEVWNWEPRSKSGEEQNW